MTTTTQKLAMAIAVLAITMATAQAPASTPSRGKAASLLQSLLERGDQKALQQAVQSLASRTDLAPREVVEIGRMLLDSGHTQWAIDFLKAQQSKHPRSLTIGRALAEAYVESNKLDRAIAQYQSLAKLAPDSVAIQLRLGEIALWQERQDVAMAAYEAALKIQPKNRVALSKLRQLYLWNEKLEKAYQIEKVLLRLDPGNADLWKEHAQHARWLENQHEAIRACKRYLKLRPQDMEVWVWLGEGYLWTDQPQKAEPIFRFILAHDPANLKARQYLAQILQWQPGRWKEARQHFEFILRHQPEHAAAREGLRQLREIYGPRTRTLASYYTDSNRLQKTRITGAYERFVGDRWQMEWRTYYFGMAEDKPIGTVRVAGLGGALRVNRALSSRLQFTATAGLLRFQSSESFATLRLQSDFVLRNGVFAALYYQFSPVEDGVLAIKNRYRAHRLGQSFSGQFGSRLQLLMDSQVGWYSDGNRKSIFYSAAEFRLFGRKPSVHLAGIFSYENTTIQYANSTPYWTPSHFWSRSLGGVIRYPFAANRLLRAGLYLTQQPGNETARNGFIELDWRLSRYSHLRVAYRDFGSQFYAYQYIEAGFWMRW